MWALIRKVHINNLMRTEVYINWIKSAVIQSISRHLSVEGHMSSTKGVVRYSTSLPSPVPRLPTFFDCVKPGNKAIVYLTSCLRFQQVF